MDATFWGIIVLGLGGFASLVVWLIKSNNAYATEKLEGELKGLGATNEQLAEINKAQANPMSFARASEWVRKQRNGHK